MRVAARRSPSSARHRGGRFGYQAADQSGYVRANKAARITEGYLYRPGCRPAGAAVSCRARAEHLDLAGSRRRVLLMGFKSLARA